MSDKKRPTVGFISLGCPKNLVDSEVMMGLLNKAGARLTAAPDEAEILVVNTCSFIDSAKQESVDTILEMARYKTEGRAKKLIVAGCLVERYRDEIRKNIPEVDAVVGTGELEAILDAAGITATRKSEPDSPFKILSGAGLKSVAQHPQGQESLAGTHKRERGGAGHSPRSGAELGPQSRPESAVREQQGRFKRDEWHGARHELPTYLYNEATPRILSTGRVSAYIKIAEGCDHPCTFCVIPNLRGKFRSRRFESVVAEAEALVENGVREITLIGQDTTCYGEDLGLKDGLALLLDRLARIEKLKWLRFLYAYPNRISNALLATMARHAKICKYLDVPLQHASPAVLKRMKRGAGAEIFLKTIEKARSAVPGLMLRTAFIVGFPGETVEEFAELEEFVKSAEFDWMGVFTYSDEEGAGAYKLDDKLKKRTIEARRKKLMRLQQKISRGAKAEWVGRELDVLVEGESGETPLLWEARTEFHAPEIDGKVYINDFGPNATLKVGRFYRARITEAHEYDLVAEIISKPQAE